jgi:poly [ADP-ribose] polymerase
MFCSVLFCSVLFCSVLFCSVLFCSALLCSVRVRVQYKTLNADMHPVEKGGEEWSMVQQYIKNTMSSHHKHMGKVDLKEVFRVTRDGEEETFKNAGWDKDGNRKLLWHGSRLSNWTGILSQGLRIAPPEAPVSGVRQ